jgi:hypothetical protein
MPDSSLIGNAIVTKLGADATLLSFIPNGAYFDLAPPNMTRFVIVSLAHGVDEQAQGARAFEDAVYLVEARIRGDSVADRTAVRQAAARIDALLDPQPPYPPATLAVDGYALMTIYREEPIRFTEFDEVDPTILWHRRGGRYRVVMST